MEKRIVVVVLLEAGPDYPDVHAAPDDIRSGFVMGGKAHDWGYLSEPIAGAAAVTPGSDGGVIPMLRGKVVGGSSSVNGAAIRRPRPSDFDAWIATGNPLWNWEQVLPVLRELEDDPAGGEYHGCGGPLHIHRFAPATMRPVHQRFLDACRIHDFPLVADHNAPDSIGAGPIPLNLVDGVRQSAAVTHLSAARGRPNLTVRSGVMADRIDVVNGRARGVQLTNGERIAADVVVVSAGAYGSPAILMRSGVGPADELDLLGIDVVADLSAVGENLRDHPQFAVAFVGDVEALGSPEPPVQTILTFNSDASRDPSRTDLEAALFTPCAPSDWFSAPPGTVIVAIGLMKPQSRGRLRLRSADPTDPPRIWPNFFAEPNDLDRLVGGVNVVRQLLATPELRRLVGEESFPGPSVSGDLLVELVRTSTPSYAHATGTCQMGPDAGTAVVDQTGKVHGVSGLWVIDASIMPALPSVPTNFTTMMLAERCVGWMNNA
ncbi:MAG: GMC family oxidoreductase [Actinobacteria bacterium]|nr:MAG: GMC family oxidoreductase [Actinomycetota bacterium]